MMRTTGGWGRTLATALIALVFTAPLLAAVYTSLRTDAAIATSPFTWEFDREWSHYRNAMGAAGYDFPLFFRNSVMISLGAVVLTLLISVPAAYAIVRLGFGGRWLLRIAVVLRVLPAIFFLIPMYKMFVTYSLIDKVLGLILVNTFLNVTLALLVLANALLELPLEIEEAAWIDGAGVFRTLGSVVIPLLGPALVSVAVLTFLFSWADYLFAVVLSAIDATPVTVGAANFVTSYGIRWGDISAAIVLSVLPPLVFATAAQRFLIRGLAAGAVKG